MWIELLTAIGLLLFLEGAIWAVAPDGMKRLLIAVLEQPAANIRITGLTIAAIGVAIVLWIKP